MSIIITSFYSLILIKTTKLVLVSQALTNIPTFPIDSQLRSTSLDSKLASFCWVRDPRELERHESTLWSMKANFGKMKEFWVIISGTSQVIQLSDVHISCLPMLPTTKGDLQILKRLLSLLYSWISQPYTHFHHFPPNFINLSTEQWRLTAITV